MKLYYHNKSLIYRNTDLNIILNIIKNLEINSSIFEIESFICDALLEFYKANPLLKFYASHSRDFYDIENFKVKSQIEIRQRNFELIPNCYYFMCEAREIFPKDKIKLFIINDYKSFNSTLATFFHCLDLMDTVSTIIFNNVDLCQQEINLLKRIYPTNWTSLSDNLLGFSFDKTLL